MVDRAFGELPGRMQSAQEAYESVLAEAGATLPARDAVDLRIINQVRAGNGRVIGKETDLPEDQRWPDYRSLPPLPDSDGDGLPDFWEKQFGLNPGDAGDSAKISHGYANIEHYFNNTDPAGGNATVVFVSASVSRAHASTGIPGVWRVSRTGDLGSALTVKFEVGGDAVSGSDFEGLPPGVTLAAGQASASMTLKPRPDAKDNRTVVLTVAEDSAHYRVGCPSRSLIVIRQ